VALVVTGNGATTGSVAQTGIPHTGADLTTLWAGLGLLLSGALLMTVARSRRRILA
jgi:LPXTG-motif cell wall-anchored protein